MDLLVLILAAGKGTRMKSEKPKVLHTVAGRSMIDYVVDNAYDLGAKETVVVIGNGAEKVESHLGEKVKFCMQKEQRGTADAVLAAEDILKNHDGQVLILCGDMPLIKSETLSKFIEDSENNPVSFISVTTKNPKGYGRVVRGVDGAVMAITEEKDADDQIKKIKEVNTGVYLADSVELLKRLADIDDNNAQGEFYLTDIVKDGAHAFKTEDEIEFMGINDRIQLEQAGKAMWRDRAEKHMRNGVQFLDASTAYIDHEVEIEADALIYPNVFLQGRTKIGKGSIIYSGSRIADSEIGENCEIKDNCLITESFVGDKSAVGPMAQLRPGTKLLGENKIGNFVETKKAVIGKGSKSSHLTYLGDCELGEDVNVGCGTITCNYDGYNKYKTEIGDGVFVGSDVQFVAPVKIGKGALIAAGSTITKDVPKDSLGITRAEQKNMEGWVTRWKKIKSKAD